MILYDGKPALGQAWTTRYGEYPYMGPRTTQGVPVSSPEVQSRVYESSASAPGTAQASAPAGGAPAAEPPSEFPVLAAVIAGVSAVIVAVLA